MLGRVVEMRLLFLPACGHGEGDGVVVFRQLGRNAYIVTVHDAVAVGEPVWNDGVLMAEKDLMNQCQSILAEADESVNVIIWHFVMFY